MDQNAARFIGAAIAVLPLLGVAIGIGMVFYSWLSAGARNPSVLDRIFSIGILGFSLTESVALFSLLISLLILFSS